VGERARGDGTGPPIGHERAHGRGDVGGASGLHEADDIGGVLVDETVDP